MYLTVTMGAAGGQKRSVINYYEKAAEEYDKEYDIPYFKKLYDKITWRYIEPYLPESGVVLDAGGGTGKWTIPIVEKGLKVVLYDISREMLNVARRKIMEERLENMVVFKEGDICEIGFPENHFDFVLAEGDPISYCSNPHKAVGELARVLKPGCFMAAGVDSLFSVARTMLIRKGPEEALKVLREKRLFAEAWGFHCWAFSPSDLRSLFEKNGLEVVKIVGKTVAYVSRPETEHLLQDEEKAEKLLELELMLCEEPSIVGYGGHLHIVARKKTVFTG
ncbi:MAG: methyltransferase domain-containing protein [Candidatus Brockarchaeota archaeon]|nr:methyltransferase domain-containing protein [Candidatus Brockarchaeota archaeon]MBO3808488.1 methyltransferase domain-containing protein [Candidatus Brockarchaeota archaeon]